VTNFELLLITSLATALVPNQTPADG
jgi:hypothetical protein